MDHLRESESPMKLEHLLQVPLEVIKLEDLIREKSLLISPPGSGVTKESNGGRLCRSVDSLPYSSSRQRLDEGRLTQRSLSTSCLFDCCSQPSRWKDTDKFSNKAKFKTTALQLPDGSSAVVPVMDFSEETLTDVEMHKDSDDEKTIQRIRSTSPNKQEKRHNDDDDDDKEERLLHNKSNRMSEESKEKTEQIISKNEIGLSWTEGNKPRPGVVLGKVTENPTRYEDLILSHGTKVISSSSIVRSNNTVILTRDANTTRERENRDFPENIIRRSDDLDTLKLTFYNDGRKESVKEYRTRTGLDGSLSNNTDSIGAGAEVDVRYFENPQGLQLSRVLRDSNPDLQKSVCISGNTYDNTQTSSRFHIGRADSLCGNNDRSSNRIPTTSTSSLIQPRQSPSSPTIKNAIRRSSIERTWDQYDGLQISRCQREENSKIISLDGNKADGGRNNNFNVAPHHTQKNPLMMALENDKGEAETLIERHLQSYLKSSMRYVKPARESTASPSDITCNKNLSRRSSITSSSEISSKSASILQSASGQTGERIPSSAQARSPSTDTVMTEGSTKITRIVPTHHISPTEQQTSHHNHQQQQRSPTSPVDSSWSERPIARIPTRPYLRRNVSFEQPSQQQQQPISIPGIVAQGLHSPPKRFKPTSNLPSLNPSLGRLQHHHQQHGFISSRYPSGNSSGIVSGGNPTNNNNNIEYQHSPTMTAPQQQHHFPSSTQLMRSSSYANINQQQPHYLHHQQTSSPFGSHSSSPGSSNTSSNNNIRSPHRSPATGSLSQVQQQHFKYPTPAQGNNNSSSCSSNTNHAQLQQQQLNESIMIAAAAATANSSTTSSQEPFDNATYYERLRRYWEFYQKELDKAKLTEYYQKYHFYPWDILSARDETLLRQWKTQQQQQHPLHHNSILPDTGSGGGGNGKHNIDIESMTQQQQHQLALKAMNAANAAPAGSSLSKGISPSSYMTSSSISQHGRIPKAMNVSPPQASPPVGLSLQNKYNYNSQQLMQLQQIQQQRTSYQQQRHFPVQHSLPSPQHGKIPTGNFDIQNTPHYKNAYNQLAAAAAAVAAARENHGRLASESDTGLDLVTNNNEDRQYRQRISSSSFARGQTSSTVAHSEPAPLAGNNIHRQTLELALKNNFRGGSLNNNYGATNENRGMISKNSRGISPSPPLYNHHPQQSSIGWATNINNGERGGGVLNMRQESLRTASSPTLAQETPVIRRVQQDIVPPQSANIMIRKSSFVPFSGRGNESSETTVSPLTYNHRRNSDYVSNQNVVEGGGGAQAIPLHNRQHHPYPSRAETCRTLNANGKSIMGGAEHPGILKRRIGGSNGHPIGEKSNFEKSPPDKRTMTAMSPVPLIVGEEEIVTANVSPSAVLASVNMVDEEATLDGNEVVDEDVSSGNANGNNNGMWQYDHVVLLDKRIKTYMCKRCFETLKTEQQIRNHLFCKMLANHVRCHVCLQLVSSDAYPSHLQVHGVRPPEGLQLQKEERKSEELNGKNS